MDLGGTNFLVITMPASHTETPLMQHFTVTSFPLKSSLYVNIHTYVSEIRRPISLLWDSECFALTFYIRENKRNAFVIR